MNDDRLASSNNMGISKAETGTIAADRLETVVHLLQAAIMACDAIEDLENRNGLVALLAEARARTALISDQLRQART